MAVSRGDPEFADPDWERNLNFTLLHSSPALKNGWEQLDLSAVGPAVGQCCGPLGSATVTPNATQDRRRYEPMRTDDMDVVL